MESIAVAPGPGIPHVRVQVNDQHRAQISREERLIALEELEFLTGYKKSKLYQLAKTDPLLRPVRAGGRCVRWPYSRVHAWIQARIAEVDQQRGEIA